VFTRIHACRLGKRQCLCLGEEATKFTTTHVTDGIKLSPYSDRDTIAPSDTIHSFPTSTEAKQWSHDLQCGSTQCRALFKPLNLSQQNPFHLMSSGRHAARIDSQRKAYDYQALENTIVDCVN
jgi:hypothetical protein